MTEIKNAKIRSTRLGIEDNGIFDFMLHLDYGGTGQGFGGYALDEYDKLLQKRVGHRIGMEAIMRILDTVGVRNWEDLRGEYIRVRASHDKVEAIGNIVEDKWFSMEDLRS